MSVVAAYLPNGPQLQRLRAAIRDRHEIIDCSDLTGLVELCEDGRARIAVVDIFADERKATEWIADLRRRLQRVTLIAYVAFTRERAPDLFEAGRLGVDALVFLNQDDSPRALVAALDHAESRGLVSQLTAALQTVDAPARDALLLTVSRAHERLSTSGLARLLSLSPRTLSERLSRAGFPSPQQLVMWGRLIVAAQLIEDPRRSGDRVARAAAFSSGSAFRNTSRRYLRATPLEIRARGGSAYVIRELMRQVDARLATE